MATGEGRDAHGRDGRGHGQDEERQRLPPSGGELREHQTDHGRSRVRRSSAAPAASDDGAEHHGGDTAAASDRVGVHGHGGRTVQPSTNRVTASGRSRLRRARRRRRPRRGSHHGGERRRSRPPGRSSRHALGTKGAKLSGPAGRSRAASTRTAPAASSSPTSATAAGNVRRPRCPRRAAATAGPTATPAAAAEPRLAQLVHDKAGAAADSHTSGCADPGGGTAPTARRR